MINPKTATPAELRKALRRETRDWRKRGVDPVLAAIVRRKEAGNLPDNAYGMQGNPAVDWHLAVAAEWDRIADTLK